MNPLYCPIEFSSLELASKLLFYTYLPVTLVGLVFGAFILRKERFSFTSKLLFIVFLSFVVWVANNFVEWVVMPNDVVMFAWQLASMLDGFIFISALYFLFVITDKERRDISNSLKAVFLGYMGFIFIILPTAWNIAYYDTTNCEGISSILIRYIIYFMEFAVILLSAYVCRKRYLQVESHDTRRKEIMVISFGTLSFLAIYATVNFIGDITSIFEVTFLESVGMALFIASIVYSTIRYKTFSVSIHPQHILGLIIIAFVGSQLFVPKADIIDFLVTVLTFIITAIVGILLLKSASRERILREQKSEFISLATHHIASPLTAIRGYSSLLEEGIYAHDKEKERETIKKVEELSQSMSIQLNSFLESTRIEEGKLKLISEEVELESLWGDIADEIPEIRVTASGAPVYLIKGDREKLFTAFKNLIRGYDDVKGGIKIAVVLSTQGNTHTIEIVWPEVKVWPSAKPSFIEKLPKKVSDFEASILSTKLAVYYTKLIVEACGGTFSIAPQNDTTLFSMTFPSLEAPEVNPTKQDIPQKANQRA